MLVPVAGLVTAFVLAFEGSSLASVLVALGGLAAGCVLVVSAAGIHAEVGSGTPAGSSSKDSRG